MPEGGPPHVSRERSEKSPIGRKLDLIHREQNRNAKDEKKQVAATAAEAARAAAIAPTEAEKMMFNDEELVFRTNFKALIRDLAAQKKVGKVSENAVRDLMESWKISAPLVNEETWEEKWNEVVDGWKEKYKQEEKVVDAIGKAGIKYLKKGAKMAGDHVEAEEEG